MKVAIGCDHRGYKLKEELVKYLEEKGIDVCNCGTFSEESCDYPDYAMEVARKVSSGEYDRGIVICNTGIGVSIAANKVKGAYAALCLDEEYAEMSRRHNNANIIAIGASRVPLDKAKKMIDIFLNQEFEAGRHERRLNKIKEQELK